MADSVPMGDTSILRALHERINTQNEKIESAKSRITEQEERMEEMEDTLLALVMALKELEDAVGTRPPSAISPVPTGDAAQTLTNRDSTASLEELVKTQILGSIPVKLAEVEKYASCFGYLHKQSSPGRRGTLGKSFKGRPWKRRWFVIKEDGQVLYYKTMKDATDSKATPVYLKLRGYQCQENNDVSKPFAFSLVCGDVGSRPFVLAPERETESERSRWMDAFKRAIDVHTAVPVETTSPERYRRASVVSLVTSDTGGDASSTGSYADEASAELPELPESGPVASIFENATCHGWLDRRVKLNVWERAYYALKNGELFRLSGEDITSSVQGQYSLQGVMVDLVMEDDESADSREFCFSLELPREGLSIFSSESEDEFGRWFSELNNASQT